MSLALRLGLASRQRLRRLAATIRLAGQNVREDVGAGATIGTLSVAGGKGVWTFSLLEDAGRRLALEGAALKSGPAGFDFESAACHSILVRATNGTVTLSRRFGIAVLNVPETTLNTLVLSRSTFAAGSGVGTVVGSISALAQGSVLSLPNDAGGRFSLRDREIVLRVASASADAGRRFDVVIRETHPDAVARDTTLTLAAVDPAAVPPVLLLVAGQSNARKAGTSGLARPRSISV